MNRKPLPVFPLPGERVRVVFGSVKLDAETEIEKTALAFVAGEPRQDGEAWVIPVVGHGEVPAGKVHPV